MIQTPAWLAGALCAAAAASPPATVGGPFIDRFQVLDTARWAISDGWSNGEAWLNDWRKSQVSPTAAGLVISLVRNANARNGYSSGEIQSRSTYRYGYFEAKLKAAAGSGVVSGFFTYTGPPHGRPWNEIDVEILGKNTRAVQVTYHSGAEQSATTVPLLFDAAAEAHTYGFDWQPNFIRWYVDGRLIHEERGNQLALPSEPQRIYFDLWNSNAHKDWMGQFNPGGAPVAAVVSCLATAPRFSSTPLC